jgi:hypothetical protein
MKYTCLILILSILSCTNHTENKETYVGGRIVNPNTNYVTLKHNDDIIDTIILDSNNNFGFRFSMDKESVYTFKHHPESQSLYLKPGDSSVLRVNTMAFDESLSFGGDSSEENNFLINMFLLNEEDNDLILSYYKISPDAFTKKTDSLRALRLGKLSTLESKSKFSPYFKNIAISTINYEHYDMRERYAFLIRKYIPAKFKEFPKDYFSYRKGVNFNDSDLVSNFSYMRFLDNYLKNYSIEVCEPSNRECFDLNDHKNLKRRLNLVHELFENDYLKTNFFNRLIRREIVFSQTKAQLEETLSIIQKFDRPTLDEKELHQLTAIQSQYLIGSSMKDSRFKSTSLDTLSFRSIAQGQPVVLYTWSALSFDVKKSNLKKIDELRGKYPKVKFLSINLDFQNGALWQNALKQLDFKYNTEFQIISDAPFSKYSFFRNYLNKVYVIDQSFTITDNSLSLNDPKLENHILNLLNR